MIKNFEVIAIENQDQLNKLVEVMREFLGGGLEYDSVHVDETYVAYVDEVLQLRPQTEIEVGHWAEHTKPRKFSQWLQSVNKRKRK